MAKSPSANGPNGNRERDHRGRFAKGNPGGPGNPLAARVAMLRSAIIAAVDDKDVAEVVARLIVQAKSGDVAAAKLFLERVFGPPLPVDIIERLEKLETLLEEKKS
ncbi:MAG: hypothetical protein GX621_12855 [Pirellulaceae bacterium]|nr:hypothetical protein [Pirellulaceae bacterium]